MKTITFYDYLVQKRMSLNSANRYQREANSFEDWAMENEIIPQKATYNEVLDFINHCKNKGNKARTINLKGVILRYYFDYHKRAKNPALELRLKGVDRLLPKSPLSKEELDNLYHNFSDYDLIRKRDKVILGMVIYQGLNGSELQRITLEDVQLEKGVVYIKSGSKSNSRTIELKAFQLLSIQNYMLKIRPIILQKANKQSEQLFVAVGQGIKLQNVIGRMIQKIKKVEPRVISLQHIRTSLISIWIKELGLRKAQYLAGHRYVSSTERYEVESLDDLKKNITIYHPL